MTWNRFKTQASCQRQDCRCPNNGGTRPGPGYYCDVQEIRGGQTYYSSQPVACTVHTDDLDLEASYEIRRNGKPIAFIAAQRSVLSSTSLPITGSLGAFSFNLRYTLPVAHASDTTKAGPFYDYDPHNENYGTPLKYTVLAKIEGCGNYNQSTPYWNNNSYIRSTQSDVIIDADGDGKPDSYPPNFYFQKRLGERSNAIQLIPDSSSAMNKWNPISFIAKTGSSSSTGHFVFYAEGVKVLTKPISNGEVYVQTEELGLRRGYDPIEITAVYSADGANPAGWNQIQVRFERD